MRAAILNGALDQVGRYGWTRRALEESAVNLGSGSAFFLFSLGGAQRGAQVAQNGSRCGCGRGNGAFDRCFSESFLLSGAQPTGVGGAFRSGMQWAFVGGSGQDRGVDHEGEIEASVQE